MDAPAYRIALEAIHDMDPFAEQRGLTETGRRGEQGQLATHPLIRDNVSTLYQVTEGDVQLSLSPRKNQINMPKLTTDRMPKVAMSPKISPDC